MNKIIGSLVTAIALWAGTTAFVGSQMEENIEQHQHFHREQKTRPGDHFVESPESLAGKHSQPPCQTAG